MQTPHTDLCVHGLSTPHIYSVALRKVAGMPLLTFVELCQREELMFIEHLLYARPSTNRLMWIISPNVCHDTETESKIIIHLSQMC